MSSRTGVLHVATSPARKVTKLCPWATAACRRRLCGHCSVQPDTAYSIKTPAPTRFDKHRCMQSSEPPSVACRMRPHACTRPPLQLQLRSWLRRVDPAVGWDSGLQGGLVRTVGRCWVCCKDNGGQMGSTAKPASSASRQVMGVCAGVSVGGQRTCCMWRGACAARAGMRGGWCRGGASRGVGVLCGTQRRLEKQAALSLPLRLPADVQQLLPRYVCRC